MMKFVFYLFVLVCSVPTLAQVSFTTSCEIRNGQAYGYVHNHKSSFEINGDVWFYFFDSNGHMIDSEDEFEYEYVSRESTEEIEHTSAPTQACSCTFDVTGATKSKNSFKPNNFAPSTSSGIKYTTSCQIRNGQAHGYVHNHKGSFEIDGYVWFYFYDSEGHFIDSEDEYEYEYVSWDSTEEIEHTTAPGEACNCYFDVNNAVKSKKSTGTKNPAPSQRADINYKTSCEIRNNLAYGHVHNFKGSFEINGNVTFYFYDSQGKLVNSQEKYEYEYVFWERTEEIAHTYVPRTACTCVFEIKEAVSE